MGRSQLRNNSTVVSVLGSSIWIKITFEFLSQCQIIQYFPICPSKLLPGHGAQRKVDQVKTAWSSSTFMSLSHNTHWFLQLKLMGTSFPSSGTLVWGSGMGLGLLASHERPLQPSYTSQLKTHHTWVSDQPVPSALLQIFMYFFTSLLGLSFSRFQAVFNEVSSIF